MSETTTTFNDLEFKAHRIGHGAVHATIEFPNGYGASVVGGGQGLYGDGHATFEVAILHNDDLCYSTPITSDVLGWQTKDEITTLLQQIAALPKVEHCTHSRE